MNYKIYKRTKRERTALSPRPAFRLTLTLIAFSESVLIKIKSHWHLYWIGKLVLPVMFEWEF